MAAEKTKNRPPIPGIRELCLRTPLYEEFAITDRQDLWDLSYDGFHFDCFCQQCGNESVFKTGAIRPPDHLEDISEDQLIIRRFWCARDSDHEIHFVFHMQGDVFSKVGQQPSFAALAHPELDKYRSIMSRSDHAEFARAVGLAAHGIGIGAFVYMRRIFERLVEEAHVTASKNPTWIDDDYQKARMAERIQLLQALLPEFLVENRSLYSIMSKGIHELSERDCQSHFDAVRVGIELILDEKEAERQKRLKMEGAKKAIQQASQKIG